MSTGIYHELSICQYKSLNFRGKTKISPTTVFLIKEDLNEKKQLIKGKEDSLWKELLKFFLKRAFLFLIFPLVPILAHLQLLLGNNESKENFVLNNDSNDLEETARELALIFLQLKHLYRLCSLHG